MSKVRFWIEKNHYGISYFFGFLFSLIASWFAMHAFAVWVEKFDIAHILVGFILWWIAKNCFFFAMEVLEKYYMGSFCCEKHRKLEVCGGESWPEEKKKRSKKKVI